MEVTVKTLSDNGLNKNDDRDILVIEIDGKKVFSVLDGEPEDANLSRDFQDCWDIPYLMEKAYIAADNDDDFVIKNIKYDNIEDI